jgi:serine O-acetyltransferase
VVVHDVPPNSTVVGNPGHPVRVEGRRPEGPDADWVHLPDPIADAIKGLAGRIAALEERVTELMPEGAEVHPLRPPADDRPDDDTVDEAGERASRSFGPNPAGG